LFTKTELNAIAKALSWSC